MILSIENLSVYLPYLNQIRPVVRELSFSVDTGEMLGIVGESGCGKSITNLTIMGLLPPYAQVQADRLELCKQNLLTLDKSSWTQVRGKTVAMIFQNPMSSLNPTMKIGSQLLEAVYRSEHKIPNDKAHIKVIDLLDLVGLPHPRRLINTYPHELSGGMAQRVMIAMALALKPALLIADEPTTALDVTTQRQIMDLLQQLRQDYSMSIILVSHDIGLVHRYADRLQVMYAGELVESGPTHTIVSQPSHPYTKGLIASQLGYHAQPRKMPISTIAGQVPTIDRDIKGCSFAERCPIAQKQCRTFQQLRSHPRLQGTLVRCPY